jgi:hypothetical protein
MASGGRPFEVVQAGLSRCCSEIRHNAMRRKSAVFFVDLEIEGLQGPIVNTTAHAKASADRVAAYRSVLYKDLYFLRHTR